MTPGAAEHQGQQLCDLGKSLAPKTPPPRSLDSARLRPLNWSVLPFTGGGTSMEGALGASWRKRPPELNRQGSQQAACVTLHTVILSPVEMVRFSRLGPETCGSLQGGLSLPKLGSCGWGE